MRKKVWIYIKSNKNFRYFGKILIRNICLQMWSFSGMNKGIFLIPLKSTENADSNGHSCEENADDRPCLYQVLLKDLPNVSTEKRTRWHHLILSNLSTFCIFNSWVISSHMATIRLNHRMSRRFYRRCRIPSK